MKMEEKKRERVLYTKTQCVGSIQKDLITGKNENNQKIVHVFLMEGIWNFVHTEYESR